MNKSFFLLIFALILSDASYGVQRISRVGTDLSLLQKSPGVRLFRCHLRSFSSAPLSDLELHQKEKQQNESFSEELNTNSSPPKISNFSSLDNKVSQHGLGPITIEDSITTHFSADPSHYDEESVHYDAFNEENARVINQTVESALKRHNAKTVLDLTCGTGLQVFWLAKRGYKVIGSDINAKMLEVAKRKAMKEKIDITFLQGDMRTTRLGEFDAVITIFNAIGHLIKSDFEKAIQNINANLKDGGLYIFDINNLNYLTTDNNITKLTIDWQKFSNNTKARTIQYSTINEEGILASYTTSYEEKLSSKPIISRGAQTLQIYTAYQIREMLNKNGFSTLNQCGLDGSKFSDTETDCILTIAKKIASPKPTQNMEDFNFSSTYKNKH